MQQIGTIRKLARYPVKSMAGVQMNETTMGWHGIEGDRRYGVREVSDSSDFPWITASRLPELLLFQPCDFNSQSADSLPLKVMNRSKEKLDIDGEPLRSELSELAGCQVELMALKHGIFDDAFISLIAAETVSHLCAEAETPDDSRRFRANIELSCENGRPFEEDQWVGKTIYFGNGKSGPAVAITKRDVRCKMIGLDPDNATHDPALVKTAVRLNQNNAGVYGTVLRTGELSVGQSVFVGP